MFVSEDELAGQMDHLERRCSVISLEDAILGRETPRPAVVLTFDDAYESFAAALEILEGKAFPVTLFVPTGRLGGVNTWDPGTACDVKLMSRAAVAESAGRGVDVQSHGHMHVDLVAAGPAAARTDLEASVAALKELTGTTPRYLAYPWGRHDDAVRRVAAEAGFDAAFAVHRPSGDLYGLERVQVEGGDAPWLFALKTSGRYARLRAAVRSWRRG
jgi:peptidoglycan/xylan/chitin deacetylase (PgdA/CDA1 family)